MSCIHNYKTCYIVSIFQINFKMYKDYSNKEKVHNAWSAISLIFNNQHSVVHFFAVEQKCENLGHKHSRSTACGCGIYCSRMWNSRLLEGQSDQ